MNLAVSWRPVPGQKSSGTSVRPGTGGSAAQDSVAMVCDPVSTFRSRDECRRVPIQLGGLARTRYIDEVRHVMSRLGTPQHRCAGMQAT